MSTRVTILGCGSSAGVPVIGCTCNVCTSDNPKNKRRRSSVFVEADGTNLLIDTSPDFRVQALDNNLKNIDAVLYTHEHGDHSHGIDDLRAFNAMKQRSIPAYGDQRTMDLLKQRFGYIFAPPKPEYGWFRASLTANTIEPLKYFIGGAITVLPFAQIHGKITTMGYRINDFAYSTDLNDLDEKSYAALQYLSLWVVDCQGYKEAPSHSHLEQTLRWIERLRPAQAVLTHLSHDMDYDSVTRILPPGVSVAYDGMVITV